MLDEASWVTRANNKGASHCLFHFVYITALIRGPDRGGGGPCRLSDLKNHCCQGLLAHSRP